jgi:hypothetical protein
MGVLVTITSQAAVAARVFTAIATALDAAVRSLKTPAKHIFILPCAPGCRCRTWIHERKSLGALIKRAADKSEHFHRRRPADADVILPWVGLTLKSRG